MLVESPPRRFGVLAPLVALSALAGVMGFGRSLRLGDRLPGEEVAYVAEGPAADLSLVSAVLPVRALAEDEAEDLMRRLGGASKPALPFSLRYRVCITTKPQEALDGLPGVQFRLRVYAADSWSVATVDRDGHPRTEARSGVLDGTLPWTDDLFRAAVPTSAGEAPSGLPGWLCDRKFLLGVTGDGAAAVFGARPSSGEIAWVRFAVDLDTGLVLQVTAQRGTGKSASWIVQRRLGAPEPLPSSAPRSRDDEGNGSKVVEVRLGEEAPSWLPLAP